MLRRSSGPMAVVALARLACPATAVVPGGGPAATDCAVVWDGATAMRGAGTVVCEDGDPACDTDATADGTCTFSVNVCLLAGEPAGCAGAATRAAAHHATIDVFVRNDLIVNVAQRYLVTPRGHSTPIFESWGLAGMNAGRSETSLRVTRQFRR